MMKRITSFLGFLLLTLVSTACVGLFGGSGDPENARLVMDVDPGVSVTLITSNQFEEVTSEDGSESYIDFQSADTSTVTSHFDRTYSLGSHIRFYAKAFGEGDGAFSMQIFIDGEESYNYVQAADGEPIEYLYKFWNY